MTTTYNVRLTAALRRLAWDGAAPPWRRRLPRGAPGLPPAFYRGVARINALAGAAHALYARLAPGRAESQFLAYFMEAAHASEEFLWNRRGVMQCYYREGLAWQRGTRARAHRPPP